MHAARPLARIRSAGVIIGVEADDVCSKAVAVEEYNYEERKEKKGW